MFNIGSKVRCIDDTGTVLLTKGRTYTVSAVLPATVRLAEFDSISGGVEWFTSRFVKATDIRPLLKQYYGS
jgi:hypothetical protein